MSFAREMGRGLVKSASNEQLISILAPALIGGGGAALLGDKKNRVQNALLGALLGGGAGYGYSQYAGLGSGPLQGANDMEAQWEADNFGAGRSTKQESAADIMALAEKGRAAKEMNVQKALSAGSAEYDSAVQQAAGLAGLAGGAAGGIAGNRLLPKSMPRGKRIVGGAGLGGVLSLIGAAQGLQSVNPYRTSE